MDEPGKQTRVQNLGYDTGKTAFGLMMKPFAESSEENKLPILKILKQELANARRVLEIGAGTGQHAVFFAGQLSHLHWIASDRAENHSGIALWLDEAGLDNVEGPLLLDVLEEWPEVEIDAIFSANTAHIMSWPGVQALFTGVGRLLPTGGKFCLYGPFSYGGKHISESNQTFDQWLKNRDPSSGVRDFKDLQKLAQSARLTLHKDYKMPVNNQTLVWRKT